MSPMTPYAQRATHNGVHPRKGWTPLLFLRILFQGIDEEKARKFAPGDLVVGRRVVEREVTDGEQVTDGEKLIQKVESEGDGGHLIISCVCWELAR